MDLRPNGPWTPAVHEYLRHLVAAGFQGSPRVLRNEDNFEVLSFIDGDVAVDPEWQPGRGHLLPPFARTDDALERTGGMLRALHDASADFKPTITTYRFHPHPPLPGEVISHGDLGPWNTVYRGGLPIAFIDWDAAQPIAPLTDLAAAAWSFVPLASPRQLAEAGFEPLPDIARRLRSFLDAYGLTDRHAILPELQRSILSAAEQINYRPVNAHEAAEALQYKAQELEWLHDMTPHLAAAL